MSEKKGFLNFLKFDSLIENLSGYLENKLEILKIEIKEDAALMAARLLFLLLIFTLGFIVLIFLSLAIGVVINSWTNTNYLGFLIVAGFYLLVLMVFYIFRKKLKLEYRLQIYLMKLLK